MFRNPIFPSAAMPSEPVDFDTIRSQAESAMQMLIETAALQPGDLVVVGCSSSEVGGHKIGTDSSPEIARQILAGLLPVLQRNGLYLAAQCCEHLGRALIVGYDAAARYGLCPVNVIPQPKAGGSFGTAAYAAFHHPVAVESLCAQAAAGLDIGGTLIGMHLRPVVVPVRLPLRQIGCAPLTAARTRPKFVGGVRAVYDNALG